MALAGGARANNTPGGQELQFTEDGGTSASLAGGGSVSISFGIFNPLNFCDLFLSDKPQDERGRNDQFFASTTVYIVKHGEIDPNAYDVELKDAADSPNVIIGASGGLFIDELIGTGAVKYPDLASIIATLPGGSSISGVPDIGIHPLPEGTFDVVFDECEDGSYQARMDALFENAITVDYSTPLPTWPSTGLATQKGIAFIAQKAAEKTSKYVEKVLDAGYDAAAILDPTVKYIKSLGTKTLLADPGAVAVQSWVKLGEHYKGIAQDPPDPQFREVTVIPALPAPAGHSADPLVDAAGVLSAALAAEDAYAGALIHAAERYQGAEAAGDLRWALVHAREVQDISALLAVQIAHKHTAIDAFRSAVLADARPLDARAAELQAFASSVHAHGLSNDDLRQAANHGLSSTQLDELRSSIVADDVPGFSKSALLTQLDTLEAGDNDLAAAMSGFGAAMQPIIDSLHASPAVLEVNPFAHAGGPYTGAVGTPVTFDASGSTSGPYAITSYDWDLNGDGVFGDASTATPSFTYTHAYDGLVAVKVTNENALSSVAFASVTITDPNHVPEIAASTPAADPSLLVGGAQSFSALAGDADGDAVTVHWIVDGVDSGATGPSFLYTAAAIGVHTVVARAVDAKDAAVERLWVVTVQAADGDGDGWNANADCADSDAAVHPTAVEVVGNTVDDDCDGSTPDTGSPPHAAFSFTPSATGHPVAFADSSTDPNADITGWSWTFGDLGAGSSDPSPTHTYTTAGTYTVTLTLTDATGGHDTVSHDVIVTEAPIADFTFEPGAPAVGGSVVFTDTSHEAGGTITGWSWTFGDGGTSTDQSPEHTYLAAGDFDVTLVVTDSNGVTATVTKTVSAVAGDPATAPVARFRPLADRNLADGTGVGPATVVSFSDSCNCGDHTPHNMLDTVIGLPWAAPGGGDQWAIIKLKGDGTAPIDRIGVQPRADCCFEQRVKDFTVEASNDGVSFTQILAATTANNGTLQYFDVPAPVAAKYIKYRPKSNWGCCWYSTTRLTVVTDHSGSKTVPFANTSTNATSYRWSFGDGSTSTGATPSHTYAAPGTYTITLTARAADGRSSTTTGTYTANGLLPSFTYSPSSPPAGASVTFDDTSTALGVAEASATWDFGDGTALAGAHASHTYATAGAYTVRLTVLDDSGGSATTTQLVTVGGSGAGPVALFSPRQPGGQTDVARDFRGATADAASTNPGRQPASTLLDGDVFNGQWWTTDRSPGQNLTISFPATRVIEGVGFFVYGGWWEMVHDFDVSVSTTTTDSSAFTTVYHGTTAWDTRWQDFAFPAVKARYVRITPLSVSYDPGYTCCYSLAGVRIPSGSDGGPTVTFHNLSQGATSYAWDFGDGTTSTDAEPTHTYAAGGTFTVTLTATKAGGGSSTYTAEQVVRSADFTWAPSSPTNNDIVQFTDTTASGVGGTSFLWSFDDGTTSTFANPLKQFAAGTHEVSLRVTDREGHVWTKQRSIVVAAGTPRAVFAPQGSFNAAADISGATLIGVSSAYQYDGCWGGGSLLDRDLGNCGWATLYPSGGAPAWARIALAPAPGAAPWTINSVTITSQVDSGPQRPSRFELAVSDSPDPASFKAVYQSPMIDTAAPQVFTLPRPVQARYIEYRTFGNFGGSCCTGTSRLTIESGQITESHSITFTNASRNADSYTWDFGDGQTSTSGAATVTHAYAAAGTYTVKLTACASGACDTSTVIQRVLSPVTASFAFNGLATPGTANEGQTVLMQDTSLVPGAGTIALVDWTFGDGARGISNGAGSGPTHAWPDNGTYTVSETITTSLQQTATFSRQLTVLNAAPTIDLGADRSFYESRILDFNFAYGDPGANEGLTCTYDPGDGSTPTTGACGRFTYEYRAGPRTYTITATIRDKDGASATDTMIYTTLPRAQAGYASTDFTGKFPGSVYPAPYNCCGPIGIAFDSSNTAYVSDYPTGYIYKFDSHGGVPDEAHKLPNPVNCAPSGLAFSKTGRLYAARQGCGDVVEVDPVNGGVLRVVAGGIGCATGLATDPVSGDLFVTQPCYYTDLKRVSHFEDGGPVSVTGYGCCGGVDGITIGPDGTMWLEINGYLGKVDATSSATPGRLQFLMPIPSFDGVALAASTDPAQPSYIYANRNDGIITKIDLSTPTPTLTDIFVGGTRGDFVAVGPDGCLYATQSDRVVKVTFADGTCGLASTSVVPQLGLAPANASGTIGTPHTITATLTNVLAPSGTVVTFTVTGANSLTGTALADSTGVAHFSYTGTHEGADSVTATSTAGTTSLTSNPATVTWTRPPNLPPTGADDEYTVHFNGTLHESAPGVLANDTDPDDNALTASSMPEHPQHGQAALANTGELIYTPAAGYVGDDSFTYTPNDGTVDGAPVTVTIHVTDTAPTPAPDSYTTLQDQPLTIPNEGVLSNDTDPDGDPVTHAALVDQASHGQVLLAFAGGLVYTPAPGFHGVDSFTYTVTDGGLTSAPATVTILVDGPPVAVADEFSTHHTTPLEIPYASLLANDTDPENQPLYVDIASATGMTHGTLTSGPTGFLYTPTDGYVGDDTFVYRVTDSRALSGLATVTLHLTDAAPVGAADEYSVHLNQQLEVPEPGVLSNDSDSDGDSLVASSMPQHPQHGVAVLSQRGELRYTPDPGYVGDDTLTYTPSDKGLDGAPVTVTIHVTDSAPTPGPDTYTTLQDQTLTVANPGVLENDTDPDGDPVSRALLVDQASHGQVFLAFAGGFIYIPQPGYHGRDSFTYTITDGALESAPVAVSIVVDGPPDAVDDTFTTHHGTALDIPYGSLIANDSDSQGRPLSVVSSSVAGAAHGTLSTGSTGITYTPNPGFVGDDSFVYRVTNGASPSAPATVTVHVTNAAPSAADDEYSVHAGQVLHVSAPGPVGNDSDPDGDVVRVASATQPSHGTYLLSAVGDLTYTPAAGFSGTDSLTYVVTDGALDSAAATITIHVTNTVPAGAPESYSVHFGQTLHVAAPGVLGNDTDADGDPLTASSMPVHPQHGQAALASTGEVIYVPAAGYVGDDAFTYTPNDGFADGAPVTVTIHVTDAAPVALPDSATVLEGDSVSGNVLTNDSDPDGDPLSVALFSGPAHGSVSLAPDGTFTYASAPGSFGVETFTYLLTDGGISVPGTVTITVRPSNHPPLVSLAPAGPVDEGTTIPLTASGSDPDAGQALTYTWTVTPNASLVTTGALASFSSDDGPATATVTVRACDNGSPVACVEATRSIVVRNVAPTATAAATPSSQYWGMPVHFSGTATDPSRADTLVGLTYKWSFGDLQLSPDNVVDHSYATPGPYAAEFSALDKDGGLGSRIVGVSVTKRPTSVVFTAPVSQPFGPTQLSARLVDGADPATGLLAGRVLSFVAGGRTFTATTNAAGVATVTPPPFLLSGPVTVSFAGNTLYLASTSTTQLTITNAFGNGPGFFTLGDRTPTSGTVTWWGSQWEKSNVLSGGSAPSSFKGFVNAPAQTGCGTGTWTTDPGNSSGPPAAVGPYVAVIVASRITKSGSTISGNTVHILAVKTAPGYGPAPGHDGTGQVVATIC